MRASQDTRYRGPAIALHWVIAALIIAAWAIGWIMTDIPGFTPMKLRYFAWHKWLGVTVLALAVLRVLWRATHPAPPFPAALPKWERLAAEAGHGLLYLLMFAVPISGYLYSSAAGVQVVYLGVLPLPTLIAPNPTLSAMLKTVHIVCDYTLAAVVVGHLLAVVKHELIDRMPILYRMLPGRSSPPARNGARHGG
ncbi:cytochrome b [Chitinasiproducens palmae]|uniref:Cytochrome b561 n=1 Tax=Chitinasiproducens palmae TaxID=1770053 RepID=A0A1H2PTF7_9BURK|nr:cytochrome b [Chitinasiproducens palmae]SDV50388.1 cytochrome b561 [Chitinasiproducens palmae]